MNPNREVKPFTLWRHFKGGKLLFFSLQSIAKQMNI